MTALLELHGIAKTLKGQKAPRTILDGTNLTVDSGESVASFAPRPVDGM